MNLRCGFIFVKCASVKLCDSCECDSASIAFALLFSCISYPPGAVSGKNVAFHLPSAIEERINKFQFGLIFFHDHPRGGEASGDIFAIRSKIAQCPRYMHAQLLANEVDTS